MPVQLRHALEIGGVAGEVVPLRAGDDIPDRPLGATDGRSEAAMLGVHGHDAKAPEVHLVTDLDLGDPLEATPLQPGAHAARDDDVRRRAEHGQRSVVEVVPVGMGDEDGVGACPVLLVSRSPHPDQGSHPVAQDGVGEDALAIHVDGDRGMAEERHPRVGVTLHGQSIVQRQVGHSATIGACSART